MRKKDNNHLNFLRGLTCLVCGKGGAIEAAHVRYSDPRAGKQITGIGIKPNDAFAVPLCQEHHREQHAEGERNFWRRRNLDPVFISLALWQATGDQECADRIIRHAYFHN